jgi:precorrin isomerase
MECKKAMGIAQARPKENGRAIFLIGNASGT